MGKEGPGGPGCTAYLRGIVLALRPDESGPNLVKRMPGNFSSHGEYDLVSGLLKLKSQKINK